MFDIKLFNLESIIGKVPLFYVFFLCNNLSVPLYVVLMLLDVLCSVENQVEELIYFFCLHCMLDLNMHNVDALCNISF